MLGFPVITYSCMFNIIFNMSRPVGMKENQFMDRASIAIKHSTNTINQPSYFADLIRCDFFLFAKHASLGMK